MKPSLATTLPPVTSQVRQGHLHRATATDSTAGEQRNVRNAFRQQRLLAILGEALRLIEDDDDEYS